MSEPDEAKKEVNELTGVLDEAETLFAAAHRDLNALLGMLQVENLFSDEIFGLHAQQAVEKIIKTWLVILGKTYPRIHNLDALFRLLEKAGCDVSDYLTLTEFTPFGTQFRYEALVGEPSPIDRKAVIAKIQSFYSHVAAKIEAAKEAEEQQS
ncbi:MAG: HEPN domain-containing protein [Cyanobacteria bacterium J06632_3]